MARERSLPVRMWGLASRAAGWFVPPAFERDPRAKALVVSSAVLAIFGWTWIALLSGFPIALKLFSALQVAALSAAPLLLRSSGSLALASQFFTAALFVSLVSGGLATLGRGPGLFALWVVPSSALLLLDRRAALRWGIASAAAYVGLILLAASPLEPPFEFEPGSLARSRERVGLLLSPVYLIGILLFDAVRATALRRSESLARELGVSRSFLQRLIDTTPDAILVLRGGKVAFANPRAAALFGASEPAALIGRPTGELLAPASEAERPLLGERFTLGEGLEPTRIRARTLTGQIVPVEVRATRTEIEGEPGVLAVARDLSAEEAAAAQRRVMAEALEQIDEAVLLMEPSGRIVFSNPAWRRGFAAPGRGFPGEQVAQALRSREGRERLEGLQSRGVGQATGTHDEPGPDGQPVRWAFRVFPVRAGPEGETLLASFSREVTAEHALEQRMRESEKLEAVARLAGGVAHDLNNQLLVILGRLDALGERAHDGASLRDLAAIHAAATRSATVARQLLAFARRSPVDATLLDVNQVIGTVADLLRSSLPPSVRLDLELAPSLPPVLADRGQLEQALAHLAGNARAVIGGSGSLRFETAFAPLPPDVASAEGAPADRRFVAIRIRDLAPSVEAEAQRLSFEPFSGSEGGTGLELASAYGSVKQIGGFLEVESTAGAGGGMIVYLPAAAPLQAEERAEAARAPRRGARVLVVDDDAEVRAVACRALRRADYETIEAASGAEALALVERAGARVDLIVTDLSMPGMSGIGLAERLEELRPDLPMLFLTGYASAAAEYHAPSPRRALLAKPYDPAELVQRVARLLASQPGEPPRERARPD